MSLHCTGRAGDDGSITILNARATLKADKDNPVPWDVEATWQNYIDILEQNWGQVRPLDDRTSPLGQAYSQFWGAYIATNSRA